MRFGLLALALLFSGCTRPCSRATCDGCCASGTECVEGTAKLECGRGGEVCARCLSAERCLSSKCEAIAAVDAGVVDAGPPTCACSTSCCLPDGTCAPNNGIDACGPTKVFCGTCRTDQRCEQGTCVAAACSGCLDPLGACRAGTDNVACGSAGGVCTACGTDQACQSRQCVFTRCDMSNCRFGCCQPNKVCMTSSPMTCGVGGDPCQVCGVSSDGGTQQCIGGLCQ